MLRLRFRLIIAVVSVTLLVMASLGFIIGQVYEHISLNNVTDRLQKEANLVAYILAEEGLDRDTTQLLTDEFSERLDASVTIIMKDGTVIAESDTDPLLMESHDLRPEIKRFFQEKKGRIFVLAIRWKKNCFIMQSLF